jgi:hypothetical protein
MNLSRDNLLSEASATGFRFVVRGDLVRLFGQNPSPFGEWKFHQRSPFHQRQSGNSLIMVQYDGETKPRKFFSPPAIVKRLTD